MLLKTRIATWSSLLVKCYFVETYSYMATGNWLWKMCVYQKPYPSVKNTVIFTISSSHRPLTPLMNKYLNNYVQMKMTWFKLPLNFKTKSKYSIVIFISTSLCWNIFQECLCLLLLLTFAVWFHFMYSLHAPSLCDVVFLCNKRKQRGYNQMMKVDYFY